MSADTRFVWPPSPVVETPPAERAPAEPRRTPLDRFEIAFLGRTAVSFDHAARITGWTRDPESVYCPRCGGSVGPHEADGEGCADCRRKRLPWDRSLRLGPYTGVLRDAVLDLKFRSWRRTGTELGQHLGRLLAETLARAQIQPQNAVLVPVPAHWTRRLRFGVDHTQVLVRAASRASGVPVRRALARRRGPSQLQVAPSARASNVTKAFRLRRPLRQTPPLVVVLDDVRTTGATLRAASRAIRSGCAVESMWVLTAGVTPSANRREATNSPDGDGWSVSVVGEEKIAGNTGRVV